MKAITIIALALALSGCVVNNTTIHIERSAIDVGVNLIEGDSND